MGIYRTDQTLAIEDALHRYVELVATGGKRVVGFRRLLAEKYGITPQRITNIARRIGLSSVDLEPKKKKR